MFHKIGLFATLSILFFGLAWSIQYWEVRYDSAANLQKKFQKKITEAEEKVEKMVELYRQSPETLDYKKAKALLSGGSVCLLKKDSLVLWTGNFCVEKEVSGYFDWYFSSDTLWYWRKFSVDQSTNLALQLPVLVFYYLPDGSKISRLTSSVGSKGIIDLSRMGNSFEIKNSASDTIGYLTIKNAAKPRYFGFLTFLCFFFAYVTGSIFIVLIIHRVAKLTHKIHFAPIFLFGYILVLKYLWQKQGMSDMLANVINSGPGVFHDTVIDSSLIDVVLNILLLIWLLLYTYRHLSEFQFGHLNTGIRLLLAALNYYGSLVGIVLITRAFRLIVLAPGLDLRFDSIFSMGSSGFIALFGMLSLILLFFVVCFRMSFVIHQLDIPIGHKLVAILCAFILIYPFFVRLDTGYSLVLLYLASLALLMLFDLYTETKNPGLSWLLIWLIVSSGLVSVLLYKFYLDKEVVTLKRNAIQLSKPDDWMLESRLKQLYNLAKILRPPNSIVEAFLSNISNDPYIGSYYNWEYNAQDRDFENAKISPLNIRRIAHHHYQVLFEQGKVEIWRKKPSELEMTSLLYPHWPNFKGQIDLKRYPYAIYDRGILLESADNTFPESYAKLSFSENNENKLQHFKQNKFFVYRANAHSTILSGKKNTMFEYPLSFFSYLTLLMSIMVLSLAWIERYFPFLPREMPLKIFLPHSFQWKIQYSFVFLILFSFVSVAIVSRYYLQSIQIIQWKEEMLNQSEAIVKTLSESQLLHGTPDGILLNKECNFQMYNQDGKLESFAWDERHVFSNRLLDYNYLLDWRAGKLKIPEFKSVIEGGVKLMYLLTPLNIKNTPYLLIQSRDMSAKDLQFGSFFSVLLNAFVALLFIALLLSIAISHSLIAPIRQLVEKMKSIKLGRKNEPLLWQHQDELGSLIQQYNMMVESLEKSAEMMAQNEREIAWREMAKQVAHEIKNPLTPMKLSIQHLESKISSLPQEEIPSFVQRVSQTLIEQIDNLNRIASEFSNFSKLPQPDNEKIVLNDLVSSVHDLFRKREDFVFNLYVPIDEIYVFADRSHMLRILNNLIKNAIQSIPEEKKGKLDIKLYTQSGYAVIQVSDNGAGIPASMHDKVFYPNFTTKSSGTGLGLAICKDIVESYGGKIYFKTIEGKGTDFYVELPLYGEEK